MQSNRYWEVLSTQTRDISQLEKQERFASYRLVKHALNLHHNPTPSIVVANIDADIVTYNVRMFNFELELMACHLQGNAPERATDLGRGSEGYVRVERST